jgi:hypothetical protein
MDVRKLVLVLCAAVLTLTGVAWVYEWDGPQVGPSKRERALADKLEARYGAILRALKVKSLGVDARSHDVVVVFSDRVPGRKGIGRLPKLASRDACGELDVGMDTGEPFTAWGDLGAPQLDEWFDCVVSELSTRVAEMRDRP